MINNIPNIAKFVKKEASDNIFNDDESKNKIPGNITQIFVNDNIFVSRSKNRRNNKNLKFCERQKQIQDMI